MWCTNVGWHSSCRKTIPDHRTSCSITTWLSNSVGGNEIRNSISTRIWSTVAYWPNHTMAKYCDIFWVQIFWYLGNKNNVLITKYKFTYNFEISRYGISYHIVLFNIHQIRTVSRKYICIWPTELMVKMHVRASTALLPNYCIFNKLHFKIGTTRWCLLYNPSND